MPLSKKRKKLQLREVFIENDKAIKALADGVKRVVKPNIVITRSSTFKCGTPSFSKEAFALVQPEMVEVIEEWTSDKHTLSIDGVVQPIPNYPDGRYRDATNR